MLPFSISLLGFVYRQHCINKEVSLDFLIFHTSGGILSKSAAFLLLIFVHTMSSSSSVNYSSLMSNWLLIIFVIGLSVIFGDFPSRFLKCFFHFCIHSSWLQLLVLLRRCSSFCSLHLQSAILIEIVYLQPSFWFYWFGLECILFRCVSSLWVFLNFWTLPFVMFLLFIKGAISMFFSFLQLLLLPIELYMWFLVWLVCTLFLLLCRQWKSFHIHNSEYMFLKCPEEYQICFLLLPLIHC